MKIIELKELFREEIKPSDTWLHNQYPAHPSKRCSPKTYLNYQNIEDCFNIEARKQIEKAIEKHPEISVVIVAVLDKRGKVRHPRTFIRNEAEYYKHYELFACSAHMPGFIEVFHNIKKKQ